MISDPARPVAFRSPVGRRRFAHGSTTDESGKDATSALDKPRLERREQRVLVFLDASVAAHHTRIDVRGSSVASQWPPECGRRSPSAVRCIDATRPLIEFDDDPTYNTVWDGNQKAPSRATMAFDVGRSPSIVSDGTRSIHLPTRVSSMGARVRGAVDSTRKTPPPLAGTGRPPAPDGGPVGEEPDLAQQLGRIHDRGAHDRECDDRRGDGTRWVGTPGW